MNVTPKQIDEAVQLMRGEIAELLNRAIESAEKHRRKASVSVIFTAKHDKKSPHILVVSAILKAKEPKGQRVDVSGTSESEDLLRIDTEEENGQERVELDGDR